jgi:hypothetical protein
MKWIFVLFIAGSLLILQPRLAEAGRTTVYIGVSVGGAAIVGGAFLIWSLSYSTRVSKQDTIPNPFPSLISTARNNQRHRTKPISHQLLQMDGQPSQSLKVELPLFRFQW